MLTRLLGVMLAGVLLAACASTAPAAPPPKRGWDGTIKIGKPYQVNGVWYYPGDDPAYDETGIASWYGPGFHGAYTANGESYDMDQIGAAHKTLPLPSFVEVTNLENGRVLTVRLNDRGPFVEGRIIDLSRRAAQLLGMQEKGTAKVRVRRVYPLDRPEVALLPPPKARPSGDLPSGAVPPPVPQGTVLASALPPPGAVPGAALPPPASVAAAASLGSGYFVQVAAFADAGRAAAVAADVGQYGPAVRETAAASQLTRVKLGPYLTREAAQIALDRIRSAGYPDARIVAPRTS